MGNQGLDAVRKLACALPEVNERRSHGAPCFFIQDKGALCYYHDDHRGDGRVSLWFPVRCGGREEMADIDPERFFKPPSDGLARG